MSEQSKSNTIGNMLWRFAERCGAQGVAFVVSLVLARLLAPEVYGTVALVTVVTSILNVFVDSGLGTALIQKKDADELDFSTVFYFNVCLCLFLYALLFLAAPWLAAFYNDLSLIPVIRALGLTLVISGVKNIQIAYVSKQMIFKKFFFATLAGTIGAAVVGIVLAYMGFGVWALVVQQLFNNAVDTMILWLTVPWRPKWTFSWKRMKGLFQYGWKLLASSLMNVAYGNLYQLVIGKVYSVENLAFMNRGQKFPEIIAANLNTSVDSILLPVMSWEQDDRNRVKEMTQRAIKTGIYVMAPMMIGLAVVAEPMIQLVLTEKWLPCVLFLRIACADYLFFPVHTANLNAIKAIGRSDIFLKLEIVKSIVGIAVLVVTVPFGVKIMAYGILVSSLLCLIINAWPNKKLLRYGFLEQLRDICPYLLLGAAMGLPVYLLQFLQMPVFLILIVQVLCGAGIYVTLSVVLKVDIFVYLWTKVRSTVLNKRNHNG